jgi:cadmium resistance protein CadD (predicted permease)
MKPEFVGSSICTAVSATTTAIQPNAVLQYISIAITIISGLISIMLGLRAWWKDAKKDGKIDKEEVEDAIKILSDGVNVIIDKTQKGEKKK